MAVHVPNVPGVPSVVFAAATEVITLLTRDAISLFTGFPISPWGIYQGGVPVVLAETVTAFDYKQQWSISDFPVERGGFESYNKVAVPFETGFRFAAGGVSIQRQQLLASIAAIAGNTELYDVVTPDAVYINVNVSRYDYRQTATDGVGLVQVDVFTTEIRQVVGVALSNTQAPTSAAQTNSGPVQAVAATSTQETRLGPIAAAGG